MLGVELQTFMLGQHAFTLTCIVRVKCVNVQRGIPSQMTVDSDFCQFEKKL